jgi:hypothetical protein
MWDQNINIRVNNQLHTLLIVENKIIPGESTISSEERRSCDKIK